MRFNIKIDEIFLKLKDQEKKLEDLINSQKFIDNEFENLKQCYKLNETLSTKKKKRNCVSNERKLMPKRTRKNEEKMRDDWDQYHRRENLKFYGIPNNQNKNTNYIIKAMAKKLNIDLKDNDISTSHRLPKSSSNNHPIIIARFTNRDAKNLIFQKRKKLIGVRDYGIDGMTSLFINKNLTPRRKNYSPWLTKKKKLQQNINSFGHIIVFIRKNTSSDRIKIIC